MIALIARYQFSCWVEHSLLVGRNTALIDFLLLWIHLMLLNPHLFIQFYLLFEFISILLRYASILMPPFLFNLQKLFWVLLNAFSICSLILCIQLEERSLLSLLAIAIISWLMKSLEVLQLLLFDMVYLLLSLRLMLSANFFLILNIMSIHFLSLVK